MECSRTAVRGMAVQGAPPEGRPGVASCAPRSGVGVFQDSALAAEGPEAEERVGRLKKPLLPLIKDLPGMMVSILSVF